jgi:hypothetical protein
MHLGLEVTSALSHPRLPGAAAAEQVGQDVAERADVGPERRGVEAKAAAAEHAAGVVLLALVLVGQDRVRLLDLLEALLGGRVIGVRVGVVLTRKLAVGLLDLLLRGPLLDAQGVVVVVRHYPSSAAPTTTRAGRSNSPFRR